MNIAIAPIAEHLILNNEELIIKNLKSMIPSLLTINY